MKKTIFISMLLILWQVSFAAIVVNTSGPYTVGQNIGFNKSCHDTFTSYASCVWNFGDGTTITYANDQNQGWQYHYYKNPGTYPVSYTRYSPTTTPMCFPSTDTLNISIKEDRSLVASPAYPAAGQEVQFTAINFNTPTNIRWDMGDGTIYSAAQMRRIQGQSTVSHTYNLAGTYTVRAFDWNGDTSTTPVTLVLTVSRPIRAIGYTPPLPRVDEKVYFTALHFSTAQVDWNFGDGVIVPGGGINQTHRFQADGTYTVSAKEAGMNQAPTIAPITILPENRFITVSPPEVHMEEDLTITAFNFRGDLLLWDFGDGTRRSGGHTEHYVYHRAGTFTITAWDENGKSQKPFTASVTVRGITDAVSLDIAEISFENGKYYQVVPRNARNFRALLKLKMGGTGIVSGQWLVDGHAYEFFSEVAIEGEVKQIFTRNVPGLPVLTPGLHTVTVQLTRPTGTKLNFPVLKYFVLAAENTIETVSPADGFIAKDKEIPVFSWKTAPGASHYRVAFSNFLYPLLENTPTVQWIDVQTQTGFTPDPGTWDAIKRNQWTYWKVQAVDSLGSVVAESDIVDIKVIIAEAKISLRRVTDLEGREIKLDGSFITSKDEHILVFGSIEYQADAQFLVLQVFADDEPVDQLLFREVKKGETREFETSVPNKKKGSHIRFQVLRSSSPSIILGIQELIWQ